MPVRPELYAAIGAAASPSFAKDGRTLLHLRGSGLAQLWALDPATGSERQLTHHDEKVALFRRSPVDDRVIYGIDRGGDERQQLWLIDASAASADAVPLTDDPAVIHGWGAWSPDGGRIAYTANRRDEAHFDVFVRDLGTGDATCVYQGENLVAVSAFSPDGASLALLRDRGEGDQTLLILDLKTGTATPVPQPGPTGWKSVRFASDGQSLLALTDHGGADFLRLCRIDPAAATVEPLYEAVGRDLEAWQLSSRPSGATQANAPQAAAPLANATQTGATQSLGKETQKLATIENDRGYSVLRVGNMGEDRPVVAGLPQGVISDLAFSPDGSVLAFVVSTPTEPAALWLLEGDAIRCIWRPSVDAGLPPFADAALVAWQGEDGMPVPGFLLLPPAPTPQGGHKAVIWVHGGPAAQTRPSFRPDIQMLVALGCVVLLPNVRGSTGYGRRSTESDDGAKRPAAVGDLAQARHWLAAHPAVDADRIAVMGQSYGGYMVNAAVTAYADLWKAAICYYGIVDFVTTLEGTGPWRRDHRAAEYADPGEPGLFGRISPIHAIDNVRVPMLVAHGSRDPRVPIGESEQLVAALRERQRQVTYLTFDYAGHGFIRPDDRRIVYTAVADFLTAQL
jgi:dipeptidyl aminopeptidase/acylaminoacyl peptidase